MQQATNGAYRDGRYLGKLAAQRREQPHIAVARWSGVKDRAAFTAGYLQGYSVTSEDRDRDTLTEAMDK